MSVEVKEVISCQQALTARETIATDIINFAGAHNLQIHPGQEPFKWAVLVLKKGGCPCVPGRNYCPCESALEDIKQINRCRCGLYCNGAYIEQYNELRGQLKGRKGGPESQRRVSKEDQH